MSYRCILKRLVYKEHLYKCQILSKLRYLSVDVDVKGPLSIFQEDELFQQL